jgi:hypothetical protein
MTPLGDDGTLRSRPATEACGTWELTLGVAVVCPSDR